MTFTLPNLLSLLRMGLIPLFIIAVVDGKPGEALSIFVIAGLTDALDGFIARFYQQQTLLGSYLDPLADKMLLTSAYVVLAIPGLGPALLIPLWVTILVIARDVVIVVVAIALSLAAGVKSFPPSVVGKLTTAAQITTVALVLLTGVAGSPVLELVASFAIYLTVALTVASSFTYFFAANRMADHRAQG